MGALTVTFAIALIACAVMVYLEYYYAASVEEISSKFLKGGTVTSFFQFLQVLPVTMLNVIGFNGLDEPKNAEERLFTKEELQTFKYKYLAIVGEVFNVATEKGIRHYGQDGHYNFFTGSYNLHYVELNLPYFFLFVLLNRG